MYIFVILLGLGTLQQDLHSIGALKGNGRAGFPSISLR